ncbi:MAG: hypothetical protein HOM58_06670 [Rhodospirillaceae bacterium]|nr:hypothetical protein [Rhodospirillaceae bacterium]MBT5456947.1 hypothetical protein [Rhodospirillaceae bacterium]
MKRNIRKIAALAAVLGAAALVVIPLAASEGHETGSDTGQAQMMQPGMIGGNMPGCTGQGGPQEMMRGMMGHMMGHMMNHMTGQGQMGPGFKGQGEMGPGQMGQGGMGQGFMDDGHHGATTERDLTADDVSKIVAGRLAWTGNKRLKVGKVTKKDDDTYIAEIVTVDDSLVQRLEVKRTSGITRKAE